MTGKGTTGYVARGDDDEDYIQVVDSTNITGSGFETIGTNLMCEPDITVQNVISKASGAVVKNASGTKVTTGNIGTGYTVTYKGKTYTIVKLGDVDYDAKVKSEEYVKIKNYIMGKNSLNSAQKKGTDVDKDGKTTSADYVKLKNYIMGKTNITI